MTPPRLPLTKALRTVLENATGKPVGLGGFPRVDAPGSPEHGQPVPPPFSVLYVSPGSVYDGPPFDDDHADATWVYHVTCVGKRLDQAQWLLDRVHGAVLDRAPDGQGYATPIPVDGMKIIRRRAVADGAPDTEGDVASVFEQYAITITGS
jgi:hypothetical protein